MVSYPLICPIVSHRAAKEGADNLRYYNLFSCRFQVATGRKNQKEKKIYTLDFGECKNKKHGEQKPPMPTPLWPCASNYDLHEKAGGMPLPTFAAPNVHPTSKRGREVCNPAGKSNFPIQKCGSKRTRHAPSRKKTTPGNRLPRKGNP